MQSLFVCLIWQNRLRRLKISPDDDVGRQGSEEVAKEGEERENGKRKEKKEYILQQGRRM